MGSCQHRVRPCPFPPTGPDHDPAAEVVELCRDLIRIDTSNYGDEEGPGERKAAEYVATLLDEVGIESTLYESEPGRTSVVATWGGPADGEPDRGALLLHGHLDVVPAAAEDWQVDPFSGEIRDGYVWGRGAVDMKDFDAMLLSVVRARARAGRRARPPGRALLHRRRGGRWPQGRRGAADAGPRRARRPAPRPSARSAGSAPPSAAGGSTSSRPPRRAWPGCG